ncbi:MAG: hypothetical protein U9N13_05555 [Euryarchaeota archaeon]|nr:hypothetical protein [Euryarchaeota archaeon]
MNTKLVAIFLAVIMVMSILPFFFSGNTSQSDDDGTVDMSNAPGFGSVAGTHVDQPFGSISDGLDMTFSDVGTAQYIDLTRTQNTPLQFLIGNTSQLDAFYGSNVLRMYSAGSADGASWIQFHEIYPQTVAYQYYLAPEAYNGYQLLSRGNNLYNVIGSPMILGKKGQVENALDVLSGISASCDKFDHILSYSGPSAEFQRVTEIENGFADQYYVGIKLINGTHYARTSVYLNATDSTISNLTSFAQNGTGRGLAYETISYGNITKVTITSNASNFYALAAEPSW